MVHDLRNPLTGIYGALSMLAGPLRETLSAGQVSMLDIAHRNTERMLDLVNAILDISRLESGRMPLSPTMFALSDVVGDVVELAQPLSEQRHVQLHNEVGSHLAPVWADRSLIGRVLQNLIGNALKFTPERGTVRVSVHLDGSEKMMVSVSDSGPGIPEDIRSQLFQKFVTGQQEGHGSGLGLAFCRMVLEAHGERIWVASEPGQGATFTFTLPLAENVV
jgi:signal transduction histidine kinase